MSSIENFFRDLYRSRGMRPISRGLRRIKTKTIMSGSRKRSFNKRRYNNFEGEVAMKGNMEMNANPKDIFLGVSDLAEMATSRIINERIEKNEECFHDTFGIYVQFNVWKEYINNNFSNLKQMQLASHRGFLFDTVDRSFLEYNIHSTHISIELVGSKSFNQKYRNILTNEFEVVTNRIEWVYGADGHSIEVPVLHDRMPVEEMYPFLEGRTLSQYYDDFMMSSASILLLIGPPGTGKTTFIRGLLQHCDISAMVSYDANILEKDFVFASFIEGDKAILVLEDADMFLKSRQDGNTMMHKFLNVGDGLVTTRNKKLIFSTNLPSIRDIDPALVRPGRCYDIISFRELSQNEAEKLAKKAGVTLKDQRMQWTISDVFFEQNTNTTKPISQKVGFI